MLDAATGRVSDADTARLRTAAGSDAAAWSEEFAVEHDPTGLRAETNVFRYRPLPRLPLVAGTGAALADVLRVVLAAACAGVPVDLYGDGPWDGLPGVTVPEGGPEPEPGGRVRVVGAVPDALRAACAEAGTSLLDAPVVTDGRREMLGVLREQAMSRTRHRFGHVESHG